MSSDPWTIPILSFTTHLSSIENMLTMRTGAFPGVHENARGTRARTVSRRRLRMGGSSEGLRYRLPIENSRRDEDQELLPVFALEGVTEEEPEDRNLTQQRDAVL